MRGVGEIGAKEDFMKRFIWWLSAVWSVAAVALLAFDVEANPRKGAALEWFPAALKNPSGELSGAGLPNGESLNGELPSAGLPEDSRKAEAPLDFEFSAGSMFDEAAESGAAVPGEETGAETLNVDSDATSEEYSGGLEIHSIQDFWTHYEVSDSFRDRYADGEPWREGEENLFVLYHLHEHLRPVRLEEWALPESALEALDSLEKPELNRRRLDAFWIHGRLLSATWTELEERVAFRYHVSGYFTCLIELDDGRKTTLFCESIPRALQKPDALREPPRVGAIAIFLKKGDAALNKTIPARDGVEEKKLASLVMAGKRLAWFPDTLLGNAGLDCGLMDELDREELPPDAKRSKIVDTRLTLRNREYFYQMMNTVFKTPPERLEEIIDDVQANAPDEYFEKLDYARPAVRNGKPVRYSSVIPLFNRPVKERGNFFYLKGIARRILPIRVEDEDVNQRFGITHYYEVFLFPDETPETPLVVLVPELPKDVKPGSDLGYYVELAVPAFFFNTWSYEKGETEEGKPIRRLAPLLIGGIPSRTLSAVYTPDLYWFYVLGSVVFGLFFFLSIVLFIVSGRNDREYARNRQKNYSLPEGADFREEVEQSPEEKEIGFEEWVKMNEQK